MYKISETGPAFCVCAGGMSVYILYRVDLLTSLVVLAAAVLYLLYCMFVLSRGGGSYKRGTAFGALMGLYAVISAAASVTLCASLITDSSVMDKTFYPLILLLTGLFAVSFGLSGKDGAVSVSFIVGAISFALLAILIFLCVLRTDFSVPEITPPEPKILLLLLAFSVFDAVLVLPLMRQTPVMMLCGGAVAHLYGAGMTMLSISVLTEGIFNSVNMPWLTLWRSTFITSFLNSFEIIGVCAFFILNAVKAGIAVNIAVNMFGRKYTVLITAFVFAAAVLISLFTGLIFAAAAVSAAAGILAPAASLGIKDKIKQP